MGQIATLVQNEWKVNRPMLTDASRLNLTAPDFYYHRVTDLMSFRPPRSNN